MNCFIELSQKDILEIEAGGLLSAVCGAAAGALIGVFVGGVATAISGDTNNFTQAVITGTSAGLWAGLGFPVP